jgi:coenzyme F420-reducing hydrogenase delta subunit/ferredoxin
MATETTHAAGIEIHDDYCGKCELCSIVCPFEAISRDEETGKLALDIEKCQMCGICVSTCPLSAIDLVYYNNDSLTSYVCRQMEETGSKTLVLTCRGSNPVTGGLEDILKNQKVTDFVSLRLPCVGRVPPEFFLKAIALGIRKILVIQCEEDYCRFKEGSRVGTNRLLLLQALLDKLGHDPKTLTIIRNPMKAVYDTEKCVGCGKCVFICPYDAIEWSSIGTPEIDLEACMGCGACALVCPHQAIELKGYEYASVSHLIQRYGIMAREARSRGVTPAVMVFCCQWSEFSALDNLQTGSCRENVMFIEVPCAKGLDPVHVLEALYSGFDGVLAVTCPKEECKLEEGKETADRNLFALRKVLRHLNLENKFETCTTSPKYPGDFHSKLESFIQKVSSISGPEMKATQ